MRKLTAPHPSVGGHRSVGGRFPTSHTRMQHGACRASPSVTCSTRRRGEPVEGFDFTDITYHRAVDQGTVRVAFDRPEVRNAFRPHTVDELYTALDHARMSTDVGCVLLTGNGPSPRDGGWAFCSGGDQRIRGKDGYKYSAVGGGGRHRARPRRAPPHPRGAAADPVHAQGRHLRRPRLGGRRRPQPARRVRPHAGQRRARPLQADRRRRRQLRRRLRLGLPGPPGRPEVRPRDLLPRSRVLGRRLPPHGRRQRGRPPRRPRGGRRWSGRRRSTPRARPRSGCSSTPST